MCKRKPDDRCAADTCEDAENTNNAYHGKFSDGPAVSPLGPTEALFMSRPVTRETAEALDWHEGHAFDAFFMAAGSDDFSRTTAEIDLYRVAIGKPHPDPDAVRTAARHVVSEAKYAHGIAIDDNARARLDRATDGDYDQALDAFRERMLGEPVEASTEFMTNAVSDVLAARELAGKDRPATQVERETYQRYVLDQALIRTDSAEHARALLAGTSTIEGEPIDERDEIAIESATDEQLTYALGQAVQFTLAAKNHQWASADNFGDTLATIVRDKCAADEAALWADRYYGRRPM